MKKLCFLILVLSLSGCSVFERMVYKIDVPQGNYLEVAQVNKLKKGMNKQQVKYLLGTPALDNTFEPNHWYYVYLQQNAYEKPQLYVLKLAFTPSGNLSGARMNRRLPPDASGDVNNTVIEITEDNN